MSSIIEVRNLVRRYGDFTAVDGIDLDVVPGEIFGLLGTNGAGKTSTLEILEGLAKPSEGHVRVYGKNPVKDRKKIRPYQAVMLQEGGFPPDLTTKETLKMWAGTLSTPLPVDNVLAMVDMTDRAGVRVSSLSGGERRRLDLACALVGQPRLLFLDEPTTGLDPESRRLAWNLLRKANENGTTIVITTHYLEEAEQLCDRLAIMHRGRIATSGTLADVVAGHHSTIRVGARPGLPRFENMTTNDGVAEIRTMNLQHDLTELLLWARNNNVALTDIDARHASLESVFLSIADEPATYAAAQADAAATRDA